MADYKKAKDIFIERKRVSGTFEEYPLIVEPNSFLVINSHNDLVMLSMSASLSSSVVSASYAKTASYAMNGGSGGPSISSSWASQSLSTSYAISASYVPQYWTESNGDIYRNAGNVSIGTSTPRGTFDVIGVEYTINNVTSSDVITFNNGAGVYPSGNSFFYAVYAYRIVNNIKIYSPHPKTFIGNDGGTDNYSISFSWDAVDDADGYKVTVLSDSVFGAFGNYYIDTTNTNVNIGVTSIGTDDVSGNSYTFKNVIQLADELNLKQSITGPNIYIDSISGSLISINPISASIFYGTSSYSVNSISASYAPSIQQISSSWASSSISSSYCGGNVSAIGVTIKALPNVTGDGSTILTIDAGVGMNDDGNIIIRASDRITISADNNASSNTGIALYTDGITPVSVFSPLNVAGPATASVVLSNLIGTASFATSASYAPQIFQISASWASSSFNSISSSYSISSSKSIISNTASFYGGSVTSASFARTASYTDNAAFASEATYADTAGISIGPWTYDGATLVSDGMQYYSSIQGTSVNISWNSGNVQVLALVNGNNTITLTSGFGGGRYLLLLQQPSSGVAGTVTWPNSSSVKWSGGTAPTLTTTNNKTDIVGFVYDGTIYYGSATLNF